MEYDLGYINGQTPLDEDEKEGCLIPTISTREELDEFEQQNIEDAILWSRKQKWAESYLLSELFVKTLHKRMYSSIWKWAGEFRKSNKNIGVDKFQIGMQLQYLLDDFRYWKEHQTYPPIEMVIRFKHRIVQIHCFSNGNGRHSRLIADLLINRFFGEPFFTWGSSNLSKPNEVREQYLKALREADRGNITPLIEFAKS